MTMEFETAPMPRLTLLEPGDIPADFAAAQGNWLVQRAAGLLAPPDTGYALIHADDGVIWGLVTGAQLITPPPSAWTPQLRSQTVQQCRVFSRKGELFIWRVAEGVWRGRKLIEQGPETCIVLPERHVLYGSQVHASQPAPPGFTSIVEPGVGMRQIVPQTVTTSHFNNGERVTLTVYHYLNEDNDRQVRIYCSRLKELQVTRV